MTRVHKQQERRMRSHHKTKAPSKKTGTQSSISFKFHENAVEGVFASKYFAGKL